MKGQKLKHCIEITGLVLLTVLVILAVIYTKKESTIFDDAQSTLQTDSVFFASDTQTEDTSDPVSRTVEWLPQIEYDDYTPSEIEQTVFRDTVILGNSQAQALGNFGLVKNADFVTKIGLSINRVLSDPDGKAPIERLYGKSYAKAVFVFGENELGWPYPANFINIYKQVIARVRELNPGIEVYVQAIFPVTKEASEESKTGITNENVRKFNASLEKMCSEIDATFMPVSDAFRDETGALPEGVAHDGVHFGYELCKVWAGDMSAYLSNAGEETETETATAAQTEMSTAEELTANETPSDVEEST